MKNQLTLPQQRLLDMMIKKKTNLIHLHGGYWTFRDVPMKKERNNTCGNFFAEVIVPVWHTSMRIVRSLEKKGLIKRANVHPEEWRDERCLA